MASLIDRSAGARLPTANSALGRIAIGIAANAPNGSIAKSETRRIGMADGGSIVKSLLLRVSRSMPRQRGSGSGWILEESGNWVGRFREYSSGKAKVIQRQLGPVAKVSEREAKKKLAKEIADFTPSVTMTFEAAAKKYIEVRSGGWGKQSKGVVQSIFKSNILPILGPLQVGAIKPTHVQSALNTIAASSSASIVIKAQTHIGGVFAMLVGDDVLVKNPARNENVRKPKTRKSDKTTLKLPEIQALIAAATDERDRVLLMILFSCAFRPSEVFALRLNDLREGKLYIDEVAIPYEQARAEGKTEGSFAGVPISQDLDLDIRMYAMRAMIQPEDFLFATSLGNPMAHSYWRIKVLANLAKAAGVKKVTFQIIRRTVATLMQQHGTATDIQSMLRHQNVSMTLGVYIQPVAESTAKMANSWSDAIRGKVN